MNTKFLILVVAVFFGSCNETLEKDASEREAKGQFLYGGNIKTAETEKYFDLFPVEIVSMSSARISQQIQNEVSAYDMCLN